MAHLASPFKFSQQDYEIMKKYVSNHDALNEEFTCGKCHWCEEYMGSGQPGFSGERVSAHPNFVVPYT